MKHNDFPSSNYINDIEVIDYEVIGNTKTE
jgi:hypothetical protein